MCYFNGIGVASDFDNAGRWLLKAEQMGASISAKERTESREAEKALWEMKRKFKDREYSEIIAKNYPRLHTAMAYMLGASYKANGYYDKAATYLRKAGDQGHQEAKTLLKTVEDALVAAARAKPASAPKPASSSPSSRPASRPSAPASTLTDEEEDEMRMASSQHHQPQLTILRRKYRKSRKQ